MKKLFLTLQCGISDNVRTNTEFPEAMPKNIHTIFVSTPWNKLRISSLRLFLCFVLEGIADAGLN